jgi:hypothetical protein
MCGGQLFQAKAQCASAATLHFEQVTRFSTLVLTKTVKAANFMVKEVALGWMRASSWAIRLMYSTW